MLAPAASDSNTVRKVLHITDMHLLADDSRRFVGLYTGRTLQQVLDMARGHDWPPDLVLVTGDCVQQPDHASYARLRQLLAPLKVPCYCLPGNHDLPALMHTELNRDGVHVEGWVETGGWRIILLDSSIPNDAAGRLADGELRRLQCLLEERPEQPTLVAFHHQPVLIQSRWLDTMALPPENRERLFSLLARHTQVKALLFGHVHQEYDNYIGGIRLLCTPSTCFQFKPKSSEFAIDRAAPGCRWIYLYKGGRLDTFVMRLPNVPAELEVNAAGY